MNLVSERSKLVYYSILMLNIQDCHTNVYLDPCISMGNTEFLVPRSSWGAAAVTTILGADGRGGGSFLQQVSAARRELGAGADMGFLMDRLDSISACSKKMYLMARIRARARQMTCSMSMVIILYGKKKSVIEKECEFECLFIHA